MAELNVLIKATNLTSAAIKDAREGLHDLERSADSVARGFGPISDAAGKAFKAVGAAAVLGAAAVGTAFAGMVVGGLKEFSNFEKGMNEVFSLLPGISQKAMDEMADQTQAFNKKFGVLAEQSVPALYQALSAGVPKENVFAFMEIAQKAAIGGVSTLETAVDGLSSVVNAYGSDVIDTGRASDLMFTAVRLGKTNFEELSGALFNVTPVAANLGVKFEDVTAALAAMTLQGVPTSVATTQLRQLLVELSKSGTDVSDAFSALSGQTFREFIASGHTLEDALGVISGGMATTTEASKKSAKEYGANSEKLANLQEALKIAEMRIGEFTHTTKASTRAVAENKIAELRSEIAELQREMRGATGQTETTTVSMNDLFGSVEAGQAAMLLTGQGTEKFRQALAEMDKSAGATQAAYETMDGGIGRSIDRIKASFQVMMQDVGEKLAPVFQKIADWVLANMPKMETTVVGVFTQIADWAMDKLPTALGKLQDAFNYVRDTLIPLAQERIPELIAKAQEFWNMIAPMISKIGEWVTAFATMDKGQRDLILTFAAVIVAIGPVASAISGLVGTVGGIVTAAGSVITALTGAAGLTASLALLAGPLGIGLAMAAVAGLAIAWSRDWGGIRSETTTKAQLIAQAVDGLMWNINGYFARGMQSARAGLANSWDGIVGLTSSAGASIGGAVSSGMYSVNSALAGGMQSARAGMSSAWGGIVALVGEAGRRMSERAGEAGSQSGAALAGGVAAKRFDFQNVLTGLAGLVSGTFRERTNDWLTAGRNVAAGIGSGVAERAGGLYESMRNLGSNLLNSFKAALGIRSPSTEFAAAGYDMAWGLSAGVDDGAWLVYDSIDTMADTSSRMIADVAQAQLVAIANMQKAAAYETSKIDAAIAATIAKNQTAVQESTRLQQQAFQLSQAQYAVYLASIAEQGGVANAATMAQALAKAQATKEDPAAAAIAAAAGGGAAAPAAPTKPAVADAPVAPPTFSPSITGSAAWNQLTAVKNAAVDAAMATLADTLSTTINSQIEKVHEAMRLLVERDAKVINPLESEISAFRKRIADTESTAKYGTPVQAAAAKAELVSLRQQLLVEETKLANYKAGTEEGLAPLKTRLTELTSALSQSLKDEARASGQPLLEGLIGKLKLPGVAAAEEAFRLALIDRQLVEKEWAALRNAKDEVARAYHQAEKMGQSQMMLDTLAQAAQNASALWAAKGLELDTQNAIVAARTDAVAKAKGTGTGGGTWADVSNSLKALVANTFSVPIQSVADKLSDFQWHNVVPFIESAGKMFKIATGQEADQQAYLIPLVKDMIKITTATATTKIADISGAIENLLSFRNTASLGHQVLTGDQLGSVSQTGNTFNVTFTGGDASVRQNILSDIQFLNSLYGGT